MLVECYFLLLQSDNYYAYKCIFQPAFGVHSTQMLVKIYNTHSCLLLQMLLSIAVHSYTQSFHNLNISGKCCFKNWDLFLCLFKLIYPTNDWKFLKFYSAFFSCLFYPFCNFHVVKFIATYMKLYSSILKLIKEWVQAV